MDTYIGLDAPASSCTVAIVGPSGRRLGSHVVETNAPSLISTVEAIPRQRRLCLEESALAGWLDERHPMSRRSWSRRSRRIALRCSISLYGVAPL